MELQAIRALSAWLTARTAARLGTRGASMVEYILLVSLIALVVLVAVRFLGSETSAKYSGTTQSMLSP
jgi:Flp pilus assembly pilin Flp